MYYVCIYIYKYVNILQINSIIIFIGVVDHYQLMVCPHALCLLTLTYATTRAHLLKNVVASFLYNAHITVQGYIILPCIHTAIVNSTHSGKLQDYMHSQYYNNIRKSVYRRVYVYINPNFVF